MTGSTSNIGRGIAVRFGAEGAHVVVSGRNKERGAAVVARIRAAGGAADFVAAELDGSIEASRSLADRALVAVDGRLDILVNNAGIYPATRSAQLDAETFARIFAVNVQAPYFLTAALAPAMAERGDGVVINLGSWIARSGIAGATAYTASKGVVESMTRALSAEYGPAGVRVNAISPGVIRDGGDEHPQAEGMMRGTPAGASGTPDAIAGAAVYLASDDAAFVHGTVLDVDGGRTTVAVLAG